MRLSVENHNNTAAGIASEHQKFFADELTAPAPGTDAEISSTLRATPARTARACELTTEQVRDVILAAAAVIPTMLDSSSQGLLAKIQSQLARGLDVNDFTAQKTLKQASSEEVRAAMRASLDGTVLTQIQSQLARGLDVNDFTAQKTLKQASSEEVRAAFANRINSNEQRSERQTGFNDNTRFGDPYHRYVQDGFRRARSRNHQQEPTSSTPPESESRPKLDETVDIISRIASSNRQYRWLQDKSPETVLPIINTTRTLRERGDSDWQIYRKYRQKAETAPKYVESVQILEALANGELGKNMSFRF